MGAREKKTAGISELAILCRFQWPKSWRRTIETRGKGAVLTWKIVKDGLSAALTGRFFHFYIQKRRTGSVDRRAGGLGAFRFEKKNDKAQPF